MPSSGLWHTSERTSSQKCQKWSLDFMVVAMASDTCLGGLLVFQCDGLIVQESLEHLPVFALKHHFELLPSSPSVIKLISVDVEGFQVIQIPGVEGLPVICLLG